MDLNDTSFTDSLAAESWTLYAVGVVLIAYRLCVGSTLRGEKRALFSLLLTKYLERCSLSRRL